MTSAVTRCLYCRGQLVFNDRGWVHQNGGGTYMMACPDCGWHGAIYPSPVACPACKSKAVRDDHCATPDYGPVP
ncbi:MAG: hypothetical protein KatS3mg082_1431 [Nitrospiraceae bacterium]|nr:MAG: hypothetical protein KatS3mg082_1431 [Nitrospiraceae bacterium]